MNTVVYFGLFSNIVQFRDKTYNCILYLEFAVFSVWLLLKHAHDLGFLMVLSQTHLTVPLTQAVEVHVESCHHHALYQQTEHEAPSGSMSHLYSNLFCAQSGQCPLQVFLRRVH